MLVPTEPKLYHIVHVDRLASITADGRLWSDAEMASRGGTGTAIGISSIKRRRLGAPLTSYPDLNVGACVPFYFCFRSVMLYVISMRNHPELSSLGGQEPIVHLEVDLHQAVAWAQTKGHRWVFTDSNAGTSYFEDYANLGDLDKIAWDAVGARIWVEPSIKEGKQAEFLLERSFPWELVSHIGVYSSATGDQVVKALEASSHRPSVRVERSWYY